VPHSEQSPQALGEGRRFLIWNRCFVVFRARDFSWYMNSYESYDIIWPSKPVILWPP
jgi:hypothetical protein